MSREMLVKRSVGRFQVEEELHHCMWVNRISILQAWKNYWVCYPNLSALVLFYFIRCSQIVELLQPQAQLLRAFEVCRQAGRLAQRAHDVCDERLRGRRIQMMIGYGRHNNNTPSYTKSLCDGSVNLTWTSSTALCCKRRASMAVMKAWTVSATITLSARLSEEACRTVAGTPSPLSLDTRYDFNISVLNS